MEDIVAKGLLDEAAADAKATSRKSSARSAKGKIETNVTHSRYLFKVQTFDNA